MDDLKKTCISYTSIFLFLKKMKQIQTSQSQYPIPIFLSLFIRKQIPTILILVLRNKDTNLKEKKILS